MPITFNEESRIFKLDTSTSSYVIKIYEGNYLLNLYYGKKIDNYSIDSFKLRPRNASFSPYDADMGNGPFSPDSAPIEFGCDGAGDFRISAIKVRNHNGDTVTDLRYQSHIIYKGKPEIKGIPSTYCNDENEATTLEINTIDKVTKLEVVLVYTVFENEGVMTKSVRIINKSSYNMVIERAYSLCNDFNTMNYDLISLYGRHCSERNIERRRLAHGIQGVESNKGITSHNHNPFIALVSRDANEDHGEAYGFNLVYSGNFSVLLECDYNNSTRLIMGINPNTFSWELKPNEIFYTPEVVCAYSSNGIGEMSRIYHRFYNQHLIRGRYKNEKRPLLINSWEGTYFDIDSEKLIEFAVAAKDIGIELLVMDDGWFGKRNDDTSSLGDWYVNEEKFPNGLKPFIDKIHDIGLKFGIWFEPEMISPNSELFRKHNDYCVHAKDREPKQGRQQYVLDVSREDVRDAIWKQMDAILSENQIDYVKWDFNRYISDADSISLPPERKKEFFHRFILGTYDLMNRLVTKYPNILFENCSGGGGRFDPAMLYYSPQIWTSDNTDAFDRLKIQFGTSLCYPASSMGAHITDCREISYKTKADVALWGTSGFELDPRRLSEEKKEECRGYVAEYHKYYDLIRFGDLYRILSPFESEYKVAWEFLDRDKTQCLLTVVCIREDHMPENFILKLKGLDEKALYKEEKSGIVYSGEFLMNVGLDISDKVNVLFESNKWYFVKIED